MPRAKKALGQNFLVDPNLQRKIVEAVDPQPGETILEIGPGTGALTRHLIERADRLIVIEKDDELAAALQHEFGHCDGFTLIHDDALALTVASLADNGTRLKIVGNIPYNITTPLLFHLLERPVRAASIVLMVQREVADRITAAPGTDAFGALTVGVQAIADTQRLFHVGRAAFRPVPNVDSTVIRITPHAPPRIDADEETDLRSLTRVAFSRRRKQLQKILRSAPEYALDTERADALLSECGVSPDARPETLAPDTFIALSRALRRAGLPADGTGASDDQPDDLTSSTVDSTSDDPDDTVRAFLAVVGHELRSPVAAILGYAELMADGLYGALDERAADGIRRIAGAARQLRGLIEGMELVVGQGHPGLEMVDDTNLVDVVHNAAEEAGVEASLRGTAIDAELDRDTPAVRTDPDALARALGLVFGAILKTSPKGTVRLTSGRTPGGVHITLEGPFEIGAEPLATPETIQTGIALRIAMAARTIVALGGRLEQASEAGRTRLRIVLPGR